MKKQDSTPRTYLSRTGNEVPLRSPVYWRSLEELSGTPEFEELLSREFPSAVSMLSDQVQRRRFLQLMAASLGLAGLGACVSRPTEEIVPYVKQPEEIVPGEPLFYATAFSAHGYAQGVLVESHTGRPTKIEGNPEHPGSQGATTAQAQASILTLYDPDRSQVVARAGKIDTYSRFLEELSRALEGLGSSGAGLRVLTPTLTSPTLGWQLDRLAEKFPESRWHQWDPVNRDNIFEGMRLAFGRSGDVRYDLRNADIIVALDSDFLSDEPGSVAYARHFAARRRVHAGAEMNRLYCAEPTPSITGSMADHRLRVRQAEVAALTRVLAEAVDAVGREGAPTLSESASSWVQSCARDLLASRGHSLVLAGPSQPPEVHALCHLINRKLGNAGHTIHYHRGSLHNYENQSDSIASLARDARDGKVDVLIVLGGNPLYDAPSDLELKASFEKIPFSAHLSLFQDETSNSSLWHVPAAHYLESWGDLRAFDGTPTLVQPLIAPLYGGKADIEILNALLGEPSKSARATLREYWEKQRGPDFESFWRQSLHDGLVKEMARPGQEWDIESPNSFLSMPVKSIEKEGLELLFRPDPNIDDGRWANNGWLQELPKPFTKLTWGNAALLSPQTAQRLGIEDGQVAEISTSQGNLQVPVWILPGQADDAVVLHLGGGRQSAGSVGDGVGVNVYPLRSREALWSRHDANLVPTGERVDLACTQNHHLIETRLASEEAERRHLIREGSLQVFRDNPHFAQEMAHEPAEDMSLFPSWKYEGYAWGMAIDLGACTGCNACVVACQAENNIPVVGKEQVLAGREMHWLRVDRYFTGKMDEPEFIHQPLPCQQCENAPCEIVCPVAATTHSPEGLNEMTYNRCVGTRYCSNNCPYKVRRFNFFLYQDWDTPTLKLLRNPDVTVRSRGVMEKCTYCVQRINEARIRSKREDRRIVDGEIATACEAACPSQAIVFGDINRPESRVSRLKGHSLNYGILTDLNTRPRTSYLARIRNPSPELTDE